MSAQYDVGSEARARPLAWCCRGDSRCHLGRGEGQRALLVRAPPHLERHLQQQALLRVHQLSLAAAQPKQRDVKAISCGGRQEAAEARGHAGLRMRVEGGMLGVTGWRSFTTARRHWRSRRYAWVPLPAFCNHAPSQLACVTRSTSQCSRGTAAMMSTGARLRMPSCQGRRRKGRGTP